MTLFFWNYSKHYNFYFIHNWRILKYKKYAVCSDLVLFQKLIVCFGVYFLVPAEQTKRKMLHALLSMPAITCRSSNPATLILFQDTQMIRAPWGQRSHRSMPVWWTEHSLEISHLPLVTENLKIWSTTTAAYRGSTPTSGIYSGWY